MKAVIMAGGMGTRLQPLTKRMPKPMVPLLDRPVMEYIVDLLASCGIRDIAVTLGYMAEAIREHFGDGSRFGVRFHYATEDFPLGTAGGVKNIEYFLDEPFVVMSGDGLTDVNLSSAIHAHLKHGALASILLAEVACPKGYGVVNVDVDGRIHSFVEKPDTWEEGLRYLVNTGIYIFEPEILKYIPANRPYDFGRELFPQLLQNHVPMYGIAVDGYWSDIGTLEQYYQTQLDMIRGLVNVPLPIEVQMTMVQMKESAGALASS
jgi:NDP-sugar pyrophosphorylase family protein